jgi:S1-C subfamily serine protease
MSFGYGYGFEQPMLRITHIAADKVYLSEDGLTGPYLITDATFVPGQSGGPVINAAGEVVMMVQLGSNSVGFGYGAEKMKSKVGRYFRKTTP